MGKHSEHKAGEHSEHKASDGTSKRSSAELTEGPVPGKLAPRRVDGALKGAQQEFEERVAAAAGKVPTTKENERDSAIGQIKKYPEFLFDLLKEGTDLALAELQSPDVAHVSPSMASLLGFAAAIAVGSAAGIMIASLATGVVHSVISKPVENGIKEAIKRGLKPGSPRPSAKQHETLLMEFRAAIFAQRGAAKLALLREFKTLHMTLESMTTEDLVALAASVEKRAEMLAPTIHDEVANQTVVAWTNALAQMKHGAMGGWDLWEKNGSKDAVALSGATPRPTSEMAAMEATASNVDPAVARQFDGAEDKDHMGILEIALDQLGNLVTDNRGAQVGHGMGMRLENVGPGARARLRRLDRVRDARINKMVRVYEVSSRWMSPVGTALITADGYVRSYDMGVFSRANVVEAPDSLLKTVGLQPAHIKINKEANERLVRSVAERAQDLPLSLLGGA